MTDLTLQSFDRDRRVGPPPAVTPLDILDLARLFHTDRELALTLATKDGERCSASRNGVEKK